MGVTSSNTVSGLVWYLQNPDFGLQLVASADSESFLDLGFQA